ncbi:MAG TPA: hypothetical protein VGE97_09090, partial [Nitrososphaera sp.]
EWIPIEPTLYPHRLLALSTLLSPIIEMPEGPIFALGKDIEFVDSYRVALGSLQLPSSIQQEVEDLPIKPYRVPVATLLPPPGHGEVAWLINGQTGERSLLTSLPVEAGGIHFKLREIVKSLMDPADWWLRTDYLAACEEGIQGYGKKFEELTSQSKTISSELLQRRLAALQQAQQREFALQLSQKNNSPLIWGTQLESLRELAKELAKMYWQSGEANRQPMQAYPTVPIQLSLDAPLEIPDVFQQSKKPKGAALSPIGLPVQAVIASLQSGPNAWKDGKESPIYTYQHQSTRATVSVRPPENLESPMRDVGLDDLWKKVREMGDLDVDTIIAQLVQYTNAPRDEDGYVWITPEQILDYRGNKRLPSGGHRNEDIKNARKMIERSAWLWVNISEETRPRRGRKGRAVPTVQEQSALILHGKRKVRLDSKGAETQEVGAIGLKPGPWWNPELEGPKLGWILQAVLKIDPYHAPFEKRFALFFTFNLRLANVGSASTEMSVRSLFYESSLESRIDPRYPERTRQHFDNALHTLKELGVISDWEYVNMPERLPSKEWLNIWLDLKIRVYMDSLPKRFTRGKENPQLGFES